MKNNSSLYPLLKVVIPTAMLISLIWQFSQVYFFINGWAQPGMTSIPLFLIQVSSISLMLWMSFKWYRNQIEGANISFGKFMFQGFLTGVGIAIFGTLLFQFYTQFINPEYFNLLEEMYHQSWLQRGLTEMEIQKQLATNEWLQNTIGGIIYGFLFVIAMTTLFSILPAIQVNRSSRFE